MNSNCYLLIKLTIKIVVSKTVWIEVISPGKLPKNLTVENIKLGNAVARNNLLVGYCSKIMIYSGLGSGIIRALSEQPEIEFNNDADGEQFIVKKPRPKESLVSI